MAEARTLAEIKEGIKKAHQQRDWSRGLVLIEDWCAQKPREVGAWYYRAFFSAQLGRYEEAKAHAEQALAFDPQHDKAKKFLVSIEKLMPEAGPAKTPAASSTPPRPAPVTAAPGKSPWSKGSLIFGRYVIKGSKRGGMGEVYFAFDRELEQMVTIKAPLPSVMENERQRQRFTREAEAWIALGMHPNICSAYYVQEIENMFRLFIEYVPGGTLEDIVAKSTGLSMKAGLEMAIQIASGMSHTHSFNWRDEDGNDHVGLVHRDLKPANILIDTDGSPKITDFGLVGLGTEVEEKGDEVEKVDLEEFEVQVEEGGEWGDGTDVHWQTITMAGSAVGTPPYMAPEQWEAAHEVGVSADIYAYGCILYELFCGRRPFVLDEKYRHAMPMHKVYLWEKLHREKEPPDPRSLKTGLNERLSKLMLSCIDKDQANRPAEFESLRETLKTIYEETQGRPYPKPEPRASRLLADSLNNQGVSYMTIAQERRAENAWAEAIKTDPHHIEANFNMALFKWRANQVPYEEVYRRMEEVGRTHKDDWRYQQILGRTYLIFGEYSKAAFQLKKAQEAEISRPGLIKDLALALCAEAASSTDAARWSEIDKFFTRVIEMGYEDPFVVAGHTISLNQMGRRDKAREYYREASERVSGLPGSLSEAVHRFLPGHELIGSIIHQGWVNFICFTPDGRQALCGSENKISLWDLRSEVPGLEGTRAQASDRWNLLVGRALNEILLRVTQVVSMGMSPDGKLILAGGASGALHLWEIKTGSLKGEFTGHTAEVSAVAFSSGGRLAVSGGADKNIHLWDTQEAKKLRTFVGHTDAVTVVKFSPDRKSVLSGSKDSTLKLWDVDKSKVIQTLEGHTDRITCADLSPDGQYVVSGSQDRTIRLWRVKDGQCLKVIKGHQARVTEVRFSADRKYIVSGSHDRTLRFWETASGRMDYIYRFENRIEAVALGPDANLILLAHAHGSSIDDKTISLLEFPSRERYRVPYAVTLPISTSLADERDSDFRFKLEKAAQNLKKGDYQKALQFLTQARDISGYEREREALNMWGRLNDLFPAKRLRTGWELETIEAHEDAVLALHVDPRGRYFISGGRDKKLILWDLKTRQKLRTFEGHTSQINAVGIFANGNFAASGGSDLTLRLWDIQSGACLRTMVEHAGEILDLAVSPDGRHALTAGRENQLFLWDMQNQKRSKVLVGHTDAVSAIEFGPDGRYALSGSLDKTLRFWDLESGTCQRVLKGHTKPITSVALSHDGVNIVSASTDSILRRWELKKDDLSVTLGGHSAPVTSVAISPDGRYALSGSEDRTIRLWNIKTGRNISTFEGHSAGVTAVAFGLDGSYAISGSLDKTIRFWHLDWEPDVREMALWDDGALPFLNNFLTLHTPQDPGTLIQRGRPRWTDEDFQALLASLSKGGYGWLQSRGVEKKLRESARKRKTKFRMPASFISTYEMLAKILYPLAPLKKPAKIFFKLLPPALLGIFLYHNHFYGLPPAAGYAAVAIFAAIMLAWR